MLGYAQISTLHHHAGTVMGHRERRQGGWDAETRRDWSAEGKAEVCNRLSTWVGSVVHHKRDRGLQYSSLSRPYSAEVHNGQPRLSGFSNVT